jgi:hypothetical protein
VLDLDKTDDRKTRHANQHQRTDQNRHQRFDGDRCVVFGSTAMALASSGDACPTAQASEADNRIAPSVKPWMIERVIVGTSRR